MKRTRINWVRFIFLHPPLATAQGWKADASETVCARNSRCQDDERAAPRGPELPGKARPGQVAGTAEPAVRPSTRAPKRRG